MAADPSQKLLFEGLLDAPRHSQNKHSRACGLENISSLSSAFNYNQAKLRIQIVI